MPAVIAENDESQWEDQTGARYHFPKQYRGILLEGTSVIYYKGRLKNKAFSSNRLSRAPHYFGVARIGKVYPDDQSKKGDLYAEVTGFTPFKAAVVLKADGQYLEAIPENRKGNYWRNGVRAIDQLTYDNILARAVLGPEFVTLPLSEPDPLSFETTVTSIEGKKIVTYGVRYERDPQLRVKAIKIHGAVCKACGFDFEKVYGEIGKGFIHVHHVKPISEYEGGKEVNPKTDLLPLCANCHAVVHRKPGETLTIDGLKSVIKGRWVVDPG